MRSVLMSMALTGLVGLAACETVGMPKVSTKQTTILLVHGAFADSSSWNGVITDLVEDGYPVVAVANPLRGVKSDAAYLTSIIRTIPGPVVLVGHSYGGEVITASGNDAVNVKALVFVAAIAPDTDESAASLGAQFPTGTLTPTLAPPVPQVDGSQDLYIQQNMYWKQFASDVPKASALQMAATQRPITEGALGETLGEPPSWKTLPTWFIYGSADKNLPRDMHAYMAERASARESIEIEGASHVVMISHPQAVADMIGRAASAE